MEIHQRTIRRGVNVHNAGKKVVLRDEKEYQQIKRAIPSMSHTVELMGRLMQTSAR